MNDQSSFDFLLVGHFAKDLIVVDGKAETSSGGGVYYGSVALRHLSKRVAVVTRLHPDDFGRLVELTNAGVTVFARPAPATSGIENLYSTADMERRITHPLGFAGAFEADQIPDVQAKIIAVVPIIAGEVDLELLVQLARRAPVALDIQGFVRVREGDDLVFRAWPDLAEGLSHVTYLKVDRAEAELLTGADDLATAARRLASYGPREIVCTESAGLTILADGEIHRAPFLPRSLEGRTGRGDTALASYLGLRLTHDPCEACRWAAAITSLKQEQPGPWSGDLAAVQALLNSRNPPLTWRHLCRCGG